MFAEFLANAQGEDIVAGIRTPAPIAELERTMPQVYRKLRTVTSRLEAHYRDVQDFEFTVQNGELFLLQTRAAKRSPLAKLRAAVEMAEEGLISRTEALLRVAPSDLVEVLSPQLDLSSVRLQAIAKGLPGWKLINMFEGGKTPLLPMSRLQALGFHIVIIPSDTQRAAIKAMQRVLTAIARNGSAAAMRGDMASFAEREAVIDTAGYLARGKTYAS